MAISKNKKRVELSLPVKQADWLKQFCKNKGITPSKYITWLLYYKAEEMLLLLKVDHTNIYTEEELKQLIATKWIED